MQVYKVKRNQNIFDVAVSTHGSIEGIFDLLINNPDLSFHSQLKEGEEIYWDEEFIIYDSIVNTLQAEHIVPANGERHVYYKNITASLRCAVYISPEEASIALQMAGDGSLIVDWGDNSDLETITLSPTLQKYVHFFDNYTNERSIKLYGDFNLKTDFKTIKSDGELRLIDGNITYSKAGFVLSQMKAFLDFSDKFNLVIFHLYCLREYHIYHIFCNISRFTMTWSHMHMNSWYCIYFYNIIHIWCLILFNIFAHIINSYIR